MKPLLLALLFAAAPLAAKAPAPAAPAAIAAVIADPARPDDLRKLDAARNPAEILAFTQVRPGDRILDIMAGAGYFTDMLGRLAGPSGRVIAWDPPGFAERPQVLAAIRARNPNATLVVGQPDALDLPPRSIDVAFFHLTYHDLYWESAKYKFPKSDPARFVQMVYAALKPGGTAVVIDHVATAGGDTRAMVEKAHRIDPAVVKADFLAAGFRLEAESPALASSADDHSLGVFDKAIRGKTDRFMFRFRKP